MSIAAVTTDGVVAPANVPPTSHDRERFWSHVNIPEGDDCCWEWTSPPQENGYGAFKYAGKKRDAHHLSLSWALGREVLKGMDTCHSCNNRKCVRPSHLSEGTRQENVAQMVAQGRQARSTGRRAATNRSGYGGVYWDERRQAWRVAAETKGKKFESGYFDSPVSAALAYDRASRDLHGVHARPNFVVDPRTEAVIRASYQAHVTARVATALPANDTTAAVLAELEKILSAAMGHLVAV